MDESTEKLEVVFYSAPIPTNLPTLTFLGLVFDRVHFPSVHIPTEGFDPKEVLAEINRIKAFNFRDYDTFLLLELMKYALIPRLREFCHFAGKPDQVFGGKDTESENVRKLVEALYDRIYGPPRENFSPSFTSGHHKGLSREQSIDYPGHLFYQTNALLYSGKHGIPLINDNPHLPVPALDGEAARNNTKLLTAIMAMECVKLVLPEIGGLQPKQLLEARAELAPYLRPFRLAMLQLASKVNAEIDVKSDQRDIMEAARFIIETDVYPTLVELKNELNKPSRGWIERAWDSTKKIPLIVAAYAQFDPRITVPALLILFGDWIRENFKKEKPRSNLYYLLKLEDRMK